jgi:hypothetical protein
MKIKLIILFFANQRDKSIFLIIIISSFIFGCSNSSANQKNNNINVDEKISEKLKIQLDSNEVKILPKVNPYYNDVAKYIAGMELQSSSAINTSLKNSNSWKFFSSNFNKSWKKMDSTHLKKMIYWREKELNEVKSKTLFYPFSGADFLNVYTFFPNADNYIMIGLEPIGSVPNFQDNMSSDTISAYFNNLNKSLYSILNNSFFRTIGMSADFKNKDLNGTIHLILLFLERTGNSIINIKPIDLNEKGEIVDLKSAKEVSNNAIEIDFINRDSELKKVYYFSVNLDNSHLHKNNNLTKFINNQTDMATYIKSASYLLHQNPFKIVRDLILTKSNYILEDDSGIPYCYFSTKEWTPKLYGKYTGPISLFAVRFQADLDSCYKNNRFPKSLNFGIGYKSRVGESNLLLFKKK